MLSVVSDWNYIDWKVLEGIFCFLPLYKMISVYKYFLNVLHKCSSSEHFSGIDSNLGPLQWNFIYMSHVARSHFFYVLHSRYTFCYKNFLIKIGIYCSPYDFEPFRPLGNEATPHHHTHSSQLRCFAVDIQCFVHSSYNTYIDEIVGFCFFSCCPQNIAAVM